MSQATKHSYSMADNLAIEAHGMAQVTQFLQSQSETLHVQNLQADPTFRSMDIDLAWMRREGTGVKAVTVEAKICMPYKTTNFFLEIISNLKKLTPGGVIYSFSDYFVFLFYYRKELYLIPAGELKLWLLQNWDKVEQRETTTAVGQGGYTTIGKMVPERDILGIPGVVKHTLDYELHPAAMQRLEAGSGAAVASAAPVAAAVEPVCSECRGVVSTKVASYSQEHFGRCLCYQCQQAEKAKAAG